RDVSTSSERVTPRCEKNPSWGAASAAPASKPDPPTPTSRTGRGMDDHPRASNRDTTNATAGLNTGADRARLDRLMIGSARRRPSRGFGPGAANHRRRDDED